MYLFAKGGKYAGNATQLFPSSIVCKGIPYHAMKQGSRAR